MPFDPHTNMNVYNYTHGQSALVEDDDSKLSSGYMSNFILHRSHQTITDSVFVFHSSDGKVYRALDSFRRDRDFPLILECREDEGEEQIYDLESAKQELFRRVLEAGGKLVEGTRPSLQIEIIDSAAHHNDYDKRSRLNCLRDPVPLQVGDVLTVLAFNEIHPHQDISRCKNSLAFRRQSAYKDAWAVQQHNVFRFELSYDEQEPQYIAPSFFYYSKHQRKNPAKQGFESVHTGCPWDLIRYENTKLRTKTILFFGCCLPDK